MLALTPDEFSTLSIAWLGSFLIVIGGLAAALPKIKSLSDQIAELFRKHDENKVAIAINTADIKDNTRTLDTIPPTIKS